MSGSGNRKPQDDKKDKVHHAVVVASAEDRAHKSPKSVSFSAKVGTPSGTNTTGNSSVATTNSNRQRHHSHTHHQIPALPPQTNGNRHSRHLSCSSTEESETEEESSPDLEYSSLSPEESGESAGDSTHIMELPENVMEFVFTFLSLPDLASASLVCSDWGRIVSDENNDVWRSHYHTQLPTEAQNFRLLAELPTYKAKLRAFYHAWNPSDCSRNIFVKANAFTIHRNPVAQSTDGVRGKIGFRQGRHAWDVVWEGPLGTVAVIGVATGRAEMRAQGYVPLLGQDDQSWGWNLVENVLLHHGVQGNYPLINNAPRYQVGDKIRVILDCEDNTLSFEKDNEFYGVAFRGLPPKERLYPAISAVYGNTEVSMIYIGAPIDG